MSKKELYSAANPRYTDLIGVGELVITSCQSSPNDSDVQQIWEQICALFQILHKSIFSPFRSYISLLGTSINNEATKSVPDIS